MNTKKILTAVLLLFVVAAVGTVVIKGLITGDAVDSSSQRVSSQESPKLEGQGITFLGDTELKSDADVEVVYYFMTTQRCQNCMKIESYTKEAVHEQFSESLNNETMIFKMVNVDETQNRHFIQDYQLYTKSVVLVRYRDGKQVEWKNLEQVWNFLGDETAFKEYVVREVNAFVKES